jgi:type VI secretion system protein VasD
MNKKNRLTVGLGAIAMALLLSACAAKPPEDVTIKGSVHAVDSINPDSLGRPSPLLVKVFQLGAVDKFEAADYFALSDSADATLGADLLGVESFLLAPGDTKPYEGEFDPQTRFIGVIAGYRDIHQAQWRAVVEMPEKSLLKLGKRGGIRIKADSLAISVTVE